MKIALFSDIHGNLPALEAVLSDIDKYRPDEIYCLGDLLNFAPWTNEVIDLLRKRNIPVVMGNHDEGIGNHMPFSFSYESEEERKAGLKAIAFTNSKITTANREYLKTLPRNLRLETGDYPPYIHTLLTHASPESITAYIGEDHNEQELLEMMDDYVIDILNPESVKVNIHRVRYDWDYTIRSIKKSKIPNIYADMLSRFIHFNA